MKRYLKRHSVLFIFALLLNAIAWTMMPGSALISQTLVDSIMEGNNERFINVLIFSGAFIILLGISYLSSGIIQENFIKSMYRSLRDDLYKSIFRRNRLDFQEKDTAGYIANIMSDVGTVVSIYRIITGVITGALISSVVALVIMLTSNLLLAAVAVGASLLSIALPLIFTKPMQRQQMHISQVRERFTTQLKEALGGYEVSNSFGIFKSLYKRFDKDNRALAQADYGFGKITSMNTGVSHVLGFATNILMILFVGFMVLNGTATIGTLVLFTSLGGTFRSGLSLLMQMMPHINSMKPISEKLIGMIDYVDNNEDIEDSNKENPNFQTSIEMKNINFGYSTDNLILKDINFQIKKNQKIALVGASGSGKTTLLRLLTGEYSKYDGDIFYDGTNMKRINKRKLHDIVSIIHQDVYIFNDTIRYNICFDEEFTEKQMSYALKISGVDKFLSKTEGGLDAPCGETGSNLSGGQRQRIALARALVRGSKFLILDEGTSSIDVETANEIEGELLNMPDLTLLTVTHRIKDGLLDEYDKVMRIDKLTSS